MLLYSAAYNHPFRFSAIPQTTLALLDNFKQVSNVLPLLPLLFNSPDFPRLTKIVPLLLINTHLIVPFLFSILKTVSQAIPPSVLLYRSPEDTSPAYKICPGDYEQDEIFFSK